MDLHQRRGLTVKEGLLSIRYEKPEELTTLPQDLPQMAQCAKTLAARLAGTVNEASRNPYR
jgi:hypothetical protein